MTLNATNEQLYHSYSWHQSHDQATVLLFVPYDTQDQDVVVVIERNYLTAGVRGKSPIVKGRLYGNVEVTNSSWELERRSSRLSARERTTSTTSTASTHSHSSYAFISDPEISSSFAASLESGQVSDAEEPAYSSTLSSPRLPPSDERAHTIRRRKPTSNITSRSVSPGQALRSPSSFSSLESLHSLPSGRLLTLCLEKDQPVIWPSLIVGPVPESLSPNLSNSVVFSSSHELEHQFNMDPTSLALMALEMYDIRKDRDEAFEYFLRAWHQAHVPTATMRLVSHYLPLLLTETLNIPEQQAARGTLNYYVQCIGGAKGLARLYLDAGMLHLEGAASSLLSTSYHSLSSIRMPLQVDLVGGGTVAWRLDRESARRYFERAAVLHPDLEVPALPLEQEPELEMPSIELGVNEKSEHDTETHSRRRRKKEELALIDKRDAKLEELDNTWYLYIPGLLGAGTAILVVGIVGALSFSTWSRRNQGS